MDVSPVHVTAYAALVAVTAAAAWTDYRDGKVYNRLTYPAMLLALNAWAIAGLVTDGFNGMLSGFGGSLVGLLAGALPLLLILSAGGLGGGDMKLMGALGAICASWQCVVSVFVYALVLALIGAVVVMVRRGLVMRTLGRILRAGLLRSPEGEEGETAKWAGSPRLPFAVAVAAGSVLAGAEHLLGWRTPWAWISL